MAGPDLFSKTVQQRANSWILDYAYYCAWEEFFSTKNIDLRTTRDFVQWIVMQPYHATNERKLKVQIMLFLCRLSDGNDHMTRYSLDSNLTALEESLRNIDMMESILGLNLSDTINTLRSSVKKQAVLVCCRADDFKAGKEVFQRQWGEAAQKKDTSTEKVIDHLKTVLESYDREQSYIKFSTYERFLKTALACLSVIHDTFTVPFLLQRAEQFEKKGHLDDEMNSTFSPKTFNEIAKMKKIKPQTEKLKQHTAKKLERIRRCKEEGKKEGNQDQETNDISGGSVTDEEITKCTFPLKRKFTQSTPKKESSPNKSLKTTQMSPSKKNVESSPLKFISPKMSLRKNGVPTSKDNVENTSKKTAKNKNNSSKQGNASSEESDAEGEMSPLRERLGLSDTASIVSSRRFARVPWNEEETNKFFQAVLKYGPGHWQEIRDHLKTFRTNVQLKDKWRNLEKDKKYMQEFTKRFGKK